MKTNYNALNLEKKKIEKLFKNFSHTDYFFLQFNLAVRDVPEVVAEAKKALCGEVVTSRMPLCVEISLRTFEGDTMILETWCLGKIICKGLAVRTQSLEYTSSYVSTDDFTENFRRNRLC